jgi:NADPH:quinone reductase-like Zn-dependent oxidoreductase
MRRSSLLEEIAIVHTPISAHLYQGASFPVWQEIGKLIDTGQVHVAIDTVVPLAEARKAHERGEAGHVRGKIVLRVVE